MVPLAPQPSHLPMSSLDPEPPQEPVDNQGQLPTHCDATPVTQTPFMLVSAPAPQPTTVVVTALPTHTTCKLRDRYGGGFVIRNDDGELLFATSNPQIGAILPHAAELEAILDGLKVGI
uniref:Uncharacterized protein n=1 Tax=Cannabis sativa TaxID=3483 RepID=A0A803QK90_CANSA